MKFIKDNRPGAFNMTGHYVSGRWTIVNTRPRYWELRLDGCKVMDYTSFAAAKAGAEECEARRAEDLDAALVAVRSMTTERYAR